MIAGVSDVEIRDAVRDMFDRVAAAPGEKYRFAVGRALAEAVGYPRALLDALPPRAGDSFTGLTCLHPYLALRSGERVLDLGCGAGVDAVIAASAVAPGGHVVGLDLSPAMITRARALAVAAGVHAVAFRTAEAEAIPFADGAFDAALVNGLLNLCPDKLEVARELHRVLRPGGRAAIAEITFETRPAAKEFRSVDDWFR